MKQNHIKPILLCVFRRFICMAGALQSSSERNQAEWRDRAAAQLLRAQRLWRARHRAGASGGINTRYATEFCSDLEPYPSRRKARFDQIKLLHSQTHTRICLVFDLYTP